MAISQPILVRFVLKFVPPAEVCPNLFAKVCPAEVIPLLEIIYQKARLSFRRHFLSVLFQILKHKNIKNSYLKKKNVTCVTEKCQKSVMCFLNGLLIYASTCTILYNHQSLRLRPSQDRKKKNVNIKTNPWD